MSAHEEDAVLLLESELGAHVEDVSILAGEVSPTGYTLPDNLSYGEWAAIGRTLHRIASATMWWLGAWWEYGERRYGDAAYQAAKVGYEADTLARAARVCRRIPPEERDERLAFGHWVALARVEESRARGRIRDRAIAEGWTVRATERAVARVKAAPVEEREGVALTEADSLDPEIHQLVKLARTVTRDARFLTTRQLHAVATVSDQLAEVVAAMRGDAHTPVCATCRDPWPCAHAGGES